MVGVLSAVVAIPMFILNSLAGLVGGAWLLWLGEWKLVIIGFVLAVAAPFWGSLLMMPGLLLAVPGVALIERGRIFIGTVFASLTGLWSYCVVTAWCIAVFWYVPKFWHTGEPVLPFVLFSYAVATGPWAVLAQKDRQSGGGDASQLATSGACVGCALMIGYILLSRRPEFATAIWFVIVPMILMFLFSVFAAFVDARDRARYR